METVTVRLTRPADHAGLVRLAALDGAMPLPEPALVAESGSRLLAALPLGAGRPIADPFEPTTELVALLKLRRSQLAAAGDVSPGRFRSLLRGRLSHAGA